MLTRVGVCDGCRGRTPGGLVDIAAARRGGRLDASSGVHPVADDEALLGGLGRGRAAGHDSDAGLELGPVLGAVGSDRRDELEAGADRTLGVVLFGDGDSPDGHDGVSDELLHDTAISGDYRPGDFEVARKDLADLFGVSFLREGRETDEVTEQHRDVAELGSRARHRGRDLSRRRGSHCRLPSKNQRGATFIAELRMRRKGRPTCRAGACQANPALKAKPAAGRVLRSAR